MTLDKQRVISMIATALRMMIGVSIYAMGIRWFYVPASMISGGITGISMMINYITQWPIGVMITIMNIPIFIVGWKKLGLKNILFSFVGMLMFSAALDIFSLFEVTVTDDPVLSAIYGGVICGIGSGIFYTSGSTSGGVDVIARILRIKYPYINFGTLLLYMDAVILFGYALIFKRFDVALYSCIAVYCSSRLIDLILYGMSQSKMCHIISEHSEEIQAEIVKSLHRGVSLIKGTGAYSGQEKQVLLCVVKRQQIVEIRRIIKNIDQKAFVIVTDARDVFGKGFENINAN